MGVGWWQYQKAPNAYTKYLMKLVLNHDIWHSVRDSHAELMLKKLGFKNVINTACPTMWRLDEDHCSAIPSKKAENVVATLTDYKKDELNDFELIKLLSSCYKKVYIWPQGSGDVEYMNKLGVSKFANILPPKLESYDDLLKSEASLDFVGTRLHAGVRALQKKRRTIILGIDNRAFEKAKDFNIVVCARDQLGQLRSLINSEFVTKIDLPLNNIETWKKQFQ